MKVNRKEEVILTALDILAYEGLDNLTMSNLAKELSLTKATLYHYYESKEELLQDIFKRGHEALSSHSFSLSLNKNTDEILEAAWKAWHSIFSDPFINPYLRAIFSLHYVNNNAEEEYKSLRLMIKSQSDVILSQIAKTTNQKSIAMLSRLFFSLIFSELESYLEGEEVTFHQDLKDFAALLTQN